MVTMVAMVAMVTGGGTAWNNRHWHLSGFHATANITSSLPHTCSAHLFVCCFRCVCGALTPSLAPNPANQAKSSRY
jgi:hypothetical protein